MWRSKYDPWANYDRWLTTPPDEKPSCPCDEEGLCPKPYEPGRQTMKCERCEGRGLICPAECLCDGDDATHWCPDCEDGDVVCECRCHEEYEPDFPDKWEREDY